MTRLMKTEAFMDGQEKPARSDKRFAVTNPANGMVLAQVADCGPEDAKSAIDAADRALQGWKKTLPKDRARILKKWHGLIVENAEELARILTLEQGKPLAESRTEITSGAAGVEWAAEEARRIYGDTIPPLKADSLAFTTREALGVVAAITPWNFPHAMVTRKVAPALAAGCTVVLKPAEDTPLSALALAALAQEAGLPAGVFNVVPTSNPVEVGAALTSDPRVAKISFTGSTQVGRILMAACAPTLKRLSLELGGNAPFIVFDDADLEAAIKGLMASKFRNAGQTCVCANRILVQAGIYGRFTQMLEDRVAGLRLGDGLAEGTTTGPLINDAAIRKVNTLLADAVTKGATLIGSNPKNTDTGLFFSPRILTGVTPDMVVFREEIFGPVAPLIPFETESEAIATANDTPYGLAAYAYTKDLGRAIRLQSGLQYGMIGVNEPLLASESIPFGGIKQSGFGREGGKNALDEFSHVKYTFLNGV